jgi:hypothetical protein
MVVSLSTAHGPKAWSRVTTRRRMTCGLVSINQKGSANMPDQLLIEPILTHPMELNGKRL